MLDPGRLVFIDETAVARTWCGSEGGRTGQPGDRQRSLGAWETITFVAALRHNKMTAPMVVEGAITGEMFLAYIEQCLVPTLKRNDIVVMDNCRVICRRHSGGDRESAGDPSLPAEVLADLNPIEMPYSKFKAFLRKVAVRTVSASIEQFAHSFRSSVLKNAPTILGMQAMLQYDRNPL